MRLARYVRTPKCACGGHLYEDRHRVKRERAKGRGTCYCEHYPFPHRRKSLFCAHGALGRLGIPFYDRNTAPVAELRSQLRTHGGLLEQAA
jgi:hypothetical protein